MERIFVSLLLLMFSAISCLAQLLSVNELNGTKWKCVSGIQAVEDKEAEYVFEYTDTEEIVTKKTNAETNVYKNPYFISNTVVKEYNTEPVGKMAGTKGKYLIVLEDLVYRKTVRNYEIEKFSSDSLQLHFLNVLKDVWISDVDNIHYKFVRIK